MEDRQELIKLIDQTKDKTVYTILRHVSTSGMSRVIDIYLIIGDEPVCIRGFVKDILGMSFSKNHDGIRVSGAGMDMGYHIVNSLSVALYCAEGYTHEGAYTLKHRWI